MICDYHFWFFVACCASHPIRLQDSLAISQERINWSVFLHGVSRQRKVPFQTTTLDCMWTFVCLVQSDSRFSGSSMSQESSDTLVFLHADSYQGKVASEAISSSWMWSNAPLVQSDCRILQIDNLSGRNHVIS